MPRIINNETKSLIHLNLMQGVAGSKTIRKLVEVFGNAEEALKASPEEIENELLKVGEVAPAGIITRLLHYPLEKELKLINEHGCHIITLHDEEDYPELLKMIDRRPPVLYVKGKLKPEDIRSIAIVGPRKARSYGRQFSHKLSYTLAEQGRTVVSGLANGIDTCAHRGALDAGGRTIAVMGRGLSDIYPYKNRKLAEEIVQSGALISEFPMDVKPESVKFPQRNRIVSGLTLGTVVVEAPNGSGSLITAEEAQKQGRKVFAVPGEILSEHSNGCHKLIENGAQRVDTVNDFLKILPELSAETITNKSVESIPEQLSLPIFAEPSSLYTGKVQKEQSEEKVKSEVIRYFRSNFPGFYIKLEHEIPNKDEKNCRSDVALIHAKREPIAIVECKRSGVNGEKQLYSYLSDSPNTNFGIMANYTKSNLWKFYKKTFDEKPIQLLKITRSEFEKGVLGDMNTK